MCKVVQSFFPTIPIELHKKTRKELVLAALNFDRFTVQQVENSAETSSPHDNNSTIARYLPVLILKIVVKKARCPTEAEIAIISLASPSSLVGLSSSLNLHEEMIREAFSLMK